MTIFRNTDHQAATVFTEETICPWCGEDFSYELGPAQISYDTRLEAHVTECPSAQEELSS